MLTEVVLYFW